MRGPVGKEGNGPEGRFFRGGRRERDDVRQIILPSGGGFCQRLTMIGFWFKIKVVLVWPVGGPSHQSRKWHGQVANREKGPVRLASA
jgi:hypothetical protein